MNREQIRGKTGRLGTEGVGEGLLGRARCKRRKTFVERRRERSSPSSMVRLADRKGFYSPKEAKGRPLRRGRGRLRGHGKESRF